jgi:spermidine synthase
MVYRIVVILAPVALCCLAASELPLYMMFCVISILLVGANIAKPQLLFQGRNTFGTLVVQMTNDGSHYLTHGNILHGVEFMSAPRPHLPIAYYHADSPIAHIFGSFKKKFRNANIAVVGLGSGTMAAYAEPGQNWTFYEINPLVVQIAEDPNLFTYLTDCKAHKTIVLGDGRQAISKANDKEYNMIAFDAFSSDAIPVHLLTKEAIHLYLSKLADGGILVFHISNRSIDLQPILRELAKDAHLTSLVEVAGQQTSSKNSLSVRVAFPEPCGLPLDRRFL